MYIGDGFRWGRWPSAVTSRTRLAARCSRARVLPTAPSMKPVSRRCPFRGRQDPPAHPAIHGPQAVSKSGATSFGEAAVHLSPQRSRRRSRSARCAIAGRILRRSTPRSLGALPSRPQSRTRILKCARNNEHHQSRREYDAHFRTAWNDCINQAKCWRQYERCDPDRHNCHTAPGAIVVFKRDHGRDKHVRDRSKRRDKHKPSQRVPSQRSWPLHGFTPNFDFGSGRCQSGNIRDGSRGARMPAASIRPRA